MSIAERRRMLLVALDVGPRRTEVAPSLQELADVLGYRSVGAVSYLLGQAREQGLVTWYELPSGRMISRTVRLTAAGRKAARNGRH